MAKQSVFCYSGSSVRLGHLQFAREHEMRPLCCFFRAWTLWRSGELSTIGRSNERKTLDLVSLKLMEVVSHSSSRVLLFPPPATYPLPCHPADSTTSHHFSGPHAPLSFPLPPISLSACSLGAGGGPKGERAIWAILCHRINVCFAW